MRYIKAQYVKSPGSTGPGVIKATGDDGVDYFIPSAQSDVAPWPAFLAAGGAILAAETPAPVIPDSVSRRQFKMQLEISGLTAAVSNWVASQTPLIRIAFDESGTFQRSDPMLQQGFAGLGFTTQQIDAFFTAAAAL